VSDQSLLLLVGEYEINIDSKNRINIPSDVRKALVGKRDGEQFYIVVGVNLRTWLYPDRVYEGLVAAQRPSKIAPGEEVLEFSSLNFAMARKIEPDKQGRIALPPETIRRSKLGKEITLVGMQDHLELWDRIDWEQYTNKLLDERAEAAKKKKPAAPTDVPPPTMTDA
jgi:MraZ protein